VNAPVLGDRARDGVIETTVQRTNVIRADGRIHFHRQVVHNYGDVCQSVTRETVNP
jgi:hypothetical protein